MKTRSLLLPFALSLVVPSALFAQSADRDLDRTAERIGRTVERAVNEAMKNVEKTLDNLSVVMREQQHGYDRRDPGHGGNRIDTTFSFSRGGTIDLTSVSGAIVVTGWNRQEVRVHAESDRSGLHWRASSTRLTIEADVGRNWDSESKYEISVPEGARLILHSQRGDITAKGTRGAVTANTFNGDIDVTDASDRVELTTLSGDITASRLSGDVTATSLNGTVATSDVDARSLHVESTSSDIVMQRVRAHDVTASTVSGDVDYTGSIETGGQYQFHSHAGTVTLTIPSDASAHFSVETFSGDLDSAFPVTLQPGRAQRPGRRIEFTIGKGDAQVTADSFSGDIVIHRGSTAKRERGE